MKHEEAKAAAHMIAACQDALDYNHSHPCSKCGRPVHIGVRHPLSAVLVIAYWQDRLGGRCKECLNKDDRKAVGE